MQRGVGPRDHTCKVGEIMKTVNTLRLVLAIGGSLFIAIGWVVALSNGTVSNVVLLGHTIIIAGAILIGAVLISSAILANK